MNDPVAIVMEWITRGAYWLGYGIMYVLQKLVIGAF
jgi:hypothetical protein